MKDERIIAYANVVHNFKRRNYGLRTTHAIKEFNHMLQNPNDILSKIEVNKLCERGDILCLGTQATEALAIFLDRPIVRSGR